MAKASGQERERRHFTAEFTVEAGRRGGGRRAGRCRSARDGRDDLRRTGQRQAAAYARVPFARESR